MFSFINKLFYKNKAARVIAIALLFMLCNVKSVWADGPPPKSSMSNPAVVIMVGLIVFLMIIIASLAYILLGSAEIRFKKWKDGNKSDAAKIAATVITCLLLIGNTAHAETDATANAVTNQIAGISPTAFYIMSSIIFFELIVIFALLFNIRSLIQAEKAKVYGTEAVVAKKKFINWWSRFNKFRPAEQESDIDLGHDYDGIRELDNRLPPWWLYGFYASILFAVIYLYRYHVAHSAPLSHEEYTMSVAKADKEIQAYLKLKGESVNENTVTMLGTDDIEAGKGMFKTSCVACHNEGGGGNVGPNLTDDYWLHGGDIKNIFKTIRYGINAMPAWQNTYSNKQIAELASYVKSLHGTNPPNPKSPQGELYKEDTASKTDSASAKKDSVSVKQ
ncbi:MAG: c-type cytochrome [Bacteroidetes bacterium]|nr:c-type cytochrome [Bacteroidota bacterium]